jgi:hypothetical protein
MDHTKFTFIEDGYSVGKTGVEYEYSAPAENFISDDLSQRSSISNPNRIAYFFKDILSQKDNGLVYAVVDNNHRVISWINAEAGKGSPADLKNYMRNAGGSAVFVVTNNSNEYQRQLSVARTYRNTPESVVLDVVLVDKDGNYSNNSGGGMNVRWQNVDAQNGILPLTDNSTNQPVLFQDDEERQQLIKDAIVPRNATTLTEAENIVKDKETGFIGKPLTNQKFNITATISGNSLSEMTSEKILNQAVSARLQAKAVANADVLFEHASIHKTHKDIHGREEVEQVHRFGALMADGNEYVPVKITVIEYKVKQEGNRIYAIEAVDIEKIKKSAGLLAPLGNAEMDVPITDFNKSLVQLVDFVNSPPFPPYFQDDALEAWLDENPTIRPKVDRFLAMMETDEGFFDMVHKFIDVANDGKDTPQLKAFLDFFGKKDWAVIMRKVANGERITPREIERHRAQLRYAPLAYLNPWAVISGDPFYAFEMKQGVVQLNDYSLETFMKNDADVVAYSQQFSSPEEFQKDYEAWNIVSNQPEGMQEKAAAGAFYKTIWDEGQKLKAEAEKEAGRSEAIETGQKTVNDFLEMVNSDLGLLDMARRLKGLQDSNDTWASDSEESDLQHRAEMDALQGAFGGKHNNWETAMKEAAGKGDINTTTKQILRGMVRKNPLPYMEAWAVITGDEAWLPADADKGKYSRLDAGEGFEGMTGNESPEERRRVSRAIAYKGVEAEIEKGTLKPDDPRLDDYEEELKVRQKERQGKIEKKKEDLSDYQWMIKSAEDNIKRQQLVLAELENDTTQEGLKETRKQQAKIKKAQNELLKLRKEESTWAQAVIGEGKKNLAEFIELLRDQAETEAAMRAIADFRNARQRKAKEVLRVPDSKKVRKNERDQVRWIQSRFTGLYKSLPLFIGPKAKPLERMIHDFLHDEKYRAGLQANMTARGYERVEEIIYADYAKTRIRSFDHMTENQKDILFDLLSNQEELQARFGILGIKEQQKFTPAESKWMRDSLAEIIPPHIMAKLENGERLHDYSIADLETLADVVVALKKKGRDELQIRNDAREKFYKDYRDAFDRIVKENFKGKVKGRQLPGSAEETIEDEKASKLKKLLYLNTNARRFFRMIEGGNDGLVHDVVTDGYRKAFYEQMGHERERREWVEQKLKDAKIDIKDLMKYTFEVEVDLDGSGIKTATINLEEALSIHYAYLNDRAHRAVMFGNFSTVDEKKRAHAAHKEGNYGLRDDIMSKGASRYRDAYNKINAFLSEHPELKMVEEILGQDYDDNYGRLYSFVADEFNEDLGSENNYMPLIRIKQNSSGVDPTKMQEVFAEAGLQQYISKGFSKNRIDVADFAQQPVKLGLYKLWDEAVTKQEHLMAYAPYLREIRGIFDHGLESDKLMNDIKQRYSKAGSDYITNFISQVANPNPQKSYNSLDSITRLVRGHYPAAVLAWRLSSIIKQAITSPPPFFAAGISVPEYISAAMECLSEDTREMIRKKSLYMYSRVYEPAIAAMKELEKMYLPGKMGKVETAINKMEQAGMKGLEWIDMVAVFPGWLAAYRKKTAELSRDNKSMSEGLIEAEAIQYADGIMADYQPSSLSFDLAPIFQGDRGGAFGQFFLQFQVPMSVIAQNVFIDTPNNFRNGRVGQGLITIAVYALTAAMVGILEEDDDDEKLNPKYRGIDALGGLIESIPIVGGSAAYSVESLLRTGKMSMSSFKPFPIIESGVKGVNGITQGQWGKAFDGAIEMFGYYSGLPVGLKREAQKAVKERDPTVLLGNH